MNVVYLDQFGPNKIRKAEKSSVLAPFGQLGEVVRSLAREGRAIFPFSDDHVVEAGKLSDRAHRQWLDHFWTEVSGGNRYMPAEALRLQQLERVFNCKPIRFASHLAVISADLPFADELEDYDQRRNEAHEKEMLKVVEYWHSQKLAQITDNTAKAEIFASIDIVQRMFEKITQGSFPSMKEINCPANALFSKVYWLLCEHDGIEPTTEKVMDWLKKHLHRIPSIRLEACLLEVLAEEYAADRNRNVANSTLHTDIHDFAAISNYLPYSYAGLFDKDAVRRLGRAEAKAQIGLPQVCAGTDLQGFIHALTLMPKAEKAATLETEECPARRTLLYIPRRRNSLIRREALSDHLEIRREILPAGGLKLSSETASWKDILTRLKATSKEYSKESGTTATIHAISKGCEIATEHNDFGLWALDRGLDERMAALP